jgi:uncharacterized membrane protein
MMLAIATLIAVAAGVAIGVICLAATFCAAFIYRRHLPSSNDAWVFW